MYLIYLVMHDSDDENPNDNVKIIIYRVHNRKYFRV